MVPTCARRLLCVTQHSHCQPTPCCSLCVLPQDEDPYVRKTAAVCVAKLYDINAELVEDRGFLDMLKVGVGVGNTKDEATRWGWAEEVVEDRGFLNVLQVGWSVFSMAITSWRHRHHHHTHHHPTGWMLLCLA